mmetsp:Transcript_12368/g.16047  ORF Transcript_12368/g.16047 Transcript_12368/m.16047 type:complete len:293 (+) Transcript_12368:164-1042(+)|eukprot:CAMPEP_0184011326 /NCGR_PEP_ID=MMETSP0954-20121128/3764_1 /TAXON_ID=627963 /ORGANISM="Aplanochytrium sp, Strain PBS07" /LENGTH=292 /DNA_ID=CAMNT_0026291129 /DNA_START=145 /DNA_END=1023 /DNA_ORIENTATION=-
MIQQLGLAPIDFNFGVSKLDLSKLMEPLYTEDMSLLDETDILNDLEKKNSLYDVKGLSGTEKYELFPTQQAGPPKPAEPAKTKKKTVAARPDEAPKSPSLSPKTKSKASRKRRTSTTSSVTSGKDSRWKSWSPDEEIFLVGVVMDRFFKRGSLSSTRADGKGNDDCWSYIKSKYDEAWKNYKTLTGKSIPQERSLNALSRHYKVMKARISQADMSGEGKVEDFKSYYDKFQEEYNIGNCLIGNPRKRSLTTEFTQRKARLAFKPTGWEGLGESVNNTTGREGMYTVRDSMMY